MTCSSVTEPLNRGEIPPPAAPSTGYHLVHTSSTAASCATNAEQLDRPSGRRAARDHHTRGRRTGPGRVEKCCSCEYRSDATYPPSRARSRRASGGTALPYPRSVPSRSQRVSRGLVLQLVDSNDASLLGRSIRRVQELNCTRAGLARREIRQRMVVVENEIDQVARRRMLRIAVIRRDFGQLFDRPIVVIDAARASHRIQQGVTAAAVHPQLELLLRRLRGRNGTRAAQCADGAIVEADADGIAQVDLEIEVLQKGGHFARLQVG